MKVTTDRHEASRSLFAIAELLLKILHCNIPCHCDRYDGVKDTDVCDGLHIGENVSTQFLSRISILTRDIDIANLSVRLSVCLSVRYVPVLYENG